MEHTPDSPGFLARQAIEVCLCLHTRKAARSVTQVFDHWLAPSGLKATQLSLLMTVNKLEPVAVGTLADALASDSTTLSRTIKPLIRQGLLEAVPGREDRRSREISLTGDGRRALDTALPLWQHAQSQVARQLGSSTVQALLPALETAAALAPADS